MNIVNACFIGDHFHFADATCLKERNFLRDRLSEFSRVFAKFVKLSSHEKSTGSQFAKLSLHVNCKGFSETGLLIVYKLGVLGHFISWCIFRPRGIKTFLAKKARKIIKTQEVFEI